MNRTTATCIAGMRSKTTTGIKTHFQRPKKPRGRSLLRGFGLSIFAKRLRWRPNATRRDDGQLDARDRSRVTVWKMDSLRSDRRLLRAQYVFLNLAGRSLGKFFDEGDAAGRLVGFSDRSGLSMIVR